MAGEDTPPARQPNALEFQRFLLRFFGVRTDMACSLMSEAGRTASSQMAYGAALPNTVRYSKT